MFEKLTSQLALLCLLLTFTGCGEGAEEDEGNRDTSTIPGATCYHLVSEIYDHLNEAVKQYPNLAELQVIGNSYEGRPLNVLRLTNKKTSGTKPAFFLMANIHGRELITSEAALEFINTMLTGYGVDADATWLLDNHDIYVMPSANPDGHVKNERKTASDPWANWRKNADTSNGGDGVDLNRNYEYKWGGAGTSTNVWNQTYPGGKAGSEPETQAIEQFLRKTFAAQRGPKDTDVAPASTTGIFITLHSYSNLVLWPWGWTKQPAPNAAQLEKLGRKLASFNGYTAQQSVGLYPTTGTTDDWAYANLGIASFTFEMGQKSDGFYPSCSRYDAIIKPNINAFIYAAKVASTPYMTPFGPDAGQVEATVSKNSTGTKLDVKATISSSSTAIDSAEVLIGAAEVASQTYRLKMTTGKSGSLVETLSGSISLTGANLSKGRHLVGVRGVDASGQRGPISAVFYDI